jgi:polyhydroxyalkanoate synthesis regulator phasin
MNEFSTNEPEAATPIPARNSRPIRRWFFGGMLGLALGAVLLGGNAFAQTDSAGTDLGQSFLDRLAGKLGVSSDELETAITDSQTEVIDEAVANGRLTEEQGEALKDRVESGEGLFRMMPGRLGVGQHTFRMLDINLATVASELGITTDELRAELADGATLSEVITSHGSTVDAVVTALVADAETELAEAVANGNLTQEQADRVLANLPDRLTQMIENGLPGDCDRWFNGSDDNDDTTDGADETSNQV